MRKIALVACAKRKLSKPAPARDLYASSLFKKSREWAERNCDEWYILSAKYGLVPPYKRLVRYEKTLNAMSSQKKKAWAQDVFRQMKKAGVVRPGVQFVWLAGQNYKKNLGLLLSSFPQRDPMKGLRMGERLRWLSKRSTDVRIQQVR